MQSHSTAVDTAEAEGDAGALLSTARAGLTWLNVRCNIAEIMELELKVDGMTCSACSSRVTEALKVLGKRFAFCLGCIMIWHTLH